MFVPLAATAPIEHANTYIHTDTQQSRHESCVGSATAVMLKTVFTLNLKEKLLPGRVAVGFFDGNTPSLVAATAGDKVLVHNARGQSPSDQSVSFLNINQTVNALATGRLRERDAHDVLVIGTPTSIFVYDVQHNTDLFYRDIPDGANVVAVGEVGSIGKPLAIAGGNCALQGFDGDGEDCYWTVTGDNITALTLADINDDNQNELLVGSEDYDIRVFKEDTIMFEVGSVTWIYAFVREPHCILLHLLDFSTSHHLFSSPLLTTSPLRLFS